MIQKISICGKGGSGKSVIITLLVKVLRNRGFKILVVDADESNTGLHKMLNFEDAPETLAQSFGGRKGVMKYWNENRLNDLLTDTIKRKSIITKNGIGLLAIGKIVDAGAGCACPLNAIVKAFLKIYKPDDNEILLVDTEAGVEHLGRGNEKYIDAIIILVDPSYESLELAKKARDMALKLGIAGERLHIVINKVEDNINKILMEGLKERGLKGNFIGSIRFDPKIQEASLLGKPLIEYNGDVIKDIEEISDKIVQSSFCDSTK